ncbi:MAG: 50S ribosomal protein L24 [Anaerolineales bacterium]|nr:MAG: 50S ribosomal protein L24 [Anaerolineales bacterium]
MKIKQGDTVEIVAGDERGERGTVREVLRGWKVDRRNRRIRRDPTKDRVIVGGLNIIKKHQRPISQTRTQTGIIELEAPIHISNVALVCSHCDEWTRVSITYADGVKVRTCKRCAETID